MPNLVKRLKNADIAYAAGTPLMDDAAYDALKSELKAADPTNPYFQRVGAPATGKKIAHTSIMGSLENSFDAEDIAKWLDQMREKGATSLVAQPKCDGVSLSVCYEDGILKYAATRGDGTQGEDVTKNAKRIPTIPKEVRGFSGIVRGEVVILREDFKKHFAPRGDANPRNSAAGTIRNASTELAPYLTFLVFDVIVDGASSGKAHDTTLARLQYLGFNTVPCRTISLNPRDVIALWQCTGDARATAAYDMDGLVLKVNDRDICATLGYGPSQCPRWALACKWRSSMIAETTVIGLENSVGRTGVITPVAILAPVLCGGVTVSRANMMNWDEVARIANGKVLGLGAGVVISREGDVIPRVLSVFKSADKPFTRPEECPVCGAEAYEHGPKQVCVNPSCTAQTFHAILHWCKNRNILHLGEAALDAAMGVSGPVNDIPDLYNLSQNDWCEVLRSDPIGKKVYASLEKSKDCTWANMLGNIGIPSIGETEAEKVCSAYNVTSLATLEACYWDVTSALGPVKAQKFTNGVAKRWSIIERLVQVLRLQKPEVPTTEGTPWAGKTFCITGATDLPRTTLRSIIEKAGGTWKSSVVSGLDYLITAEDDMNTTKAKAAQAKGIKTINEITALRMADYQ